MTYLLDSNVFIQAKNQYYGMDFCPAFWTWLAQAHASGIVISLKIVYEELQNGNDELKDWSKANSALFSLREDERSIQEYYPKVLDTIPPNITGKKRTDFEDGADPWLIAAAKVKNYTLVTHEHYDPKCKKKILIPNICEELGVAYVDTFTMLRAAQSKFILQTD